MRLLRESVESSAVFATFSQFEFVMKFVSAHQLSFVYNFIVNIKNSPSRKGILSILYLEISYLSVIIKFVLKWRKLSFFFMFNFILCVYFRVFLPFN